MRGLGAALAISLPEGETPLDWAITQCYQLPLSTWDADDLPEKFRLAGDVAQIQLTVAIYAVIARYEAGHGVEPEMVRHLTEKAWEHCHFLRQQETYRLEEPELDELAARVAITLGSPSEGWLIIQANSPQVGASRPVGDGGCLHRKQRLLQPCKRTGKQHSSEAPKQQRCRNFHTQIFGDDMAALGSI